uniref:CCHC-type domain-containing protein n=1 Tax=Cyprinodon variegatus TaxID=28743 RepID=A0A3Q2EAZ1_CYPVA
GTCLCPQPFQPLPRFSLETPLPDIMIAAYLFLSGEHIQILSHDTSLRELNTSQEQANRFLQVIARYLQDATPRTEPFPEFRLSLPERFFGLPSECKGFLFQCKLFFEDSPSSFPDDKKKIAFILSRLSGKALEWAEARFASESSLNCSFEEFVQEFMQVFYQVNVKYTESRGLLKLKQGNRTVADFSIDFRVKAAASRWNKSALKSAYVYAMNEAIKDELATLDEPATLEELISLTIHLHNRLRAKVKTNDTSFPSVSSETHCVSPSTESSEVEPMQLGHIRLTSEERQRRVGGNLCINCGESGHSVSTCPAKVKAVQLPVLDSVSHLHQISFCKHLCDLQLAPSVKKL